MAALFYSSPAVGRKVVPQFGRVQGDAAINVTPRLHAAA
jgi:hypothetical protein